MSTTRSGFSLEYGYTVSPAHTGSLRVRSIVSSVLWSTMMRLKS